MKTRAVLSTVVVLSMLTGLWGSVDAAGQFSQVVIPYISQYQGQDLEDHDCGPASAAMVLEAYGKRPVGLSPKKWIMQVRDRSGNTWGNLRFSELKAAISSYDHIGSVEIPPSPSHPDEQMQKMKDALAAYKPVIALVHGATLGRGSAYGDHFVVVRGFSDDGQSVYINDPDQRCLSGWLECGGQVTWSYSRFRQACDEAEYGPYGIIVGTGIGGSAPDGYTFCSNEGQRCEFSGTKDVAYGANGKFTYKHGVTGGIDCNNTTFGDPIYGVVKACYTRDSSSGGCTPGANQISLFVDSNYGGQCVTKGVGSYSNPGAIGLPNDSISSIKVGSNVKAMLCRDDNYGGGCETFTGSDSDLSNNSIGNDQVSSAKVESRSSGCTPGADQISLFVDSNYGGQCVTKGVGSYSNPGAIGLPNDSISSIKVGSNVRATLCRDDNYGGGCETFTGYDSDLSNNSIGNDQVSAAKVEPRSSSGPSGYTYCAREGQRCSFSGTKNVAYGANGKFAYRYGVTGGIDCNNNKFGDPISGVVKSCYTKDYNGGGSYYNLIAKHSGKCVDVSGGSRENGAAVIQWDCHGGDNQQWDLVPVGSYYKLIAQHSSKCLDVSGGSHDSGAHIIQWDCHGGDNQLWRLEPEGGYYRLVAKHSGKCLDVYWGSRDNGTQLIQWDCHGGDNQLWAKKIP